MAGIIPGRDIVAGDITDMLITSLQANIISAQNAGIAGNFPPKLTQGGVDSFIRSDGGFFTVNTTDITAIHGEDPEGGSYSNDGVDMTVGTIAGNTSAPSTYTVTATASANGYLNIVKFFVSSPQTSSVFRCEIIQNSVTLATVDTTVTRRGVHELSFDSSDYVNAISSTTSSGVFTIVFSRVSGTGTYLTTNSAPQTYSGSFWSFTSQQAMFADTLQFVYSKVATGNVITELVEKTFTSNLSEIFISIDSLVPGGSSITVDVSTDGGSTFEITSGALNTVLTLDGDNTDLVIKFNLVRSGDDSAQIYGYSYQVW